MTGGDKSPNSDSEHASAYIEIAYNNPDFDLTRQAVKRGDFYVKCVVTEI